MLINNGMSYMVTSAIEASDLIRTVEEQIDGLVRYNQSSKKWEIKLARADYPVGIQPEINEDNMVELVSYSPIQLLKVLRVQVSTVEGFSALPGEAQPEILPVGTKL